MVVTVEGLKRLEDMDIRDLKREDLDNAGDISFDRSKPANQRMKEFLEKTKQASDFFIASKADSDIQLKHAHDFINVAESYLKKKFTETPDG